MQILEHCHNNRITSYLVFEDDAIFADDFEERYERFCESLPNDWQMIYLGGQLLHEVNNPPRRVNDHVYIPYNVNRTHCFGVSIRGYDDLYRHLFNLPFAKSEHIDHHVGRLHETGVFRVYVPPRWIVGQDSGSSNISGRTNPATYWPHPELLAKDWKANPIRSSIPAVFLESHLDVAIELERRGWHRGHWQNEDRLDRGVCDAISSLNTRQKLEDWYRAVIPEAVREGKKCVCLYHPMLCWEFVQTLEFAKFERIRAPSADNAEESFRGLNVPGTGIQDLPAVPETRHLLYHIWPNRANDSWRWNVAQLLKRIDQFNGVRSIAIVTDENSATVDEVKIAFGNNRITNWIVAKNDPKLGEIVSFVKLLETIPQDSGITFYGHAKGVKYSDNQNVRDWADIMYEVCLDDTQYVDASLSQYPVTGPFKNTREYVDQMQFGWHYSGTFFWFRNADLFSRDWQSIQQDYYGTEKYLGDRFTHAEAGDLFGGHMGWLYHCHEMDRARSLLNSWRKSRRNTGVVPIYINARNLLTPLKKMVEYLVRIPGARPIIVDNDSTWEPLLEWYKSCPVEVIKTGVNGGKFGWENHVLNHESMGIPYYVVTDSDLDLSSVPVDVLDVLKRGLEENSDILKCGLSLDLDSIPDSYSRKEEVLAWEAKWHASERGSFFEAGIDTTFAMRRSAEHPGRQTWSGLRAKRPYTAIHWPWTWTPELIAESEEIRHYISTANPDGLHWTPLQKNN